MGNPYEDMFTGGGSKSKKNQSTDWMKMAFDMGGGKSANPAMSGFDVSSVIKSSKKTGGSKRKEPSISDTVTNVSKSIKQVKGTVKSIRDYKDNQLLIKAKEIKLKEEKAKRVAEAKKIVDDYNERKAEYEAREKERKKESGQQSVFQKLRNFRKNSNTTPQHLQSKNNNNP